MSIEHLKIAERYEIISEVYKLVIPIYEEQRNYQVTLFIYNKFIILSLALGISL